MNELVSRFATQVPLPLVLDSTESPVLEAGLQHSGGKAILNSVALGKYLNERVGRPYGDFKVAVRQDRKGKKFWRIVPAEDFQCTDGAAQAAANAEQGMLDFAVGGDR